MVEIFTGELVELLFDQTQDMAVLVGDVGKPAESGHPGRLNTIVPGLDGTESKSFLNRFREELLQGHASGGSHGLRLSEGSVVEIDDALHETIFP